jgi:hypothetical protein
MEGRRAVDAKDHSLHTRELGQHPLEPIHKLPDRGNEVAVHAFRQIALFIALENGDMLGCEGADMVNNSLDAIWA